MRQITKRIKKLSRSEYIVKKIREFAYVETFTLVSAFLIIGHFVNPQDLCLTQEKVPYLLIILTILTLFHGFESGFIAMTLISFSMWKFYEKFPYVDFLVYLMLVLIFSEFHYYWTKKIRELQIDDDYKASKLDEFSKAFYSLKISHDQLEKNYVLKPMSIRSAIEEIILHKNIQNNKEDTHRHNQQYKNFLALLEKSFNLQSGLIIHKAFYNVDKTLSPQNASISYGHTYQNIKGENIFDDYIIKYALERKKPVFVSDENKNPIFQQIQESQFLAAIPTVYNDEILSLLVIEKMPFMSFNRENLISIAILLEYLSIELYKQEVLELSSKIESIFKDNTFKYEYSRLQYLQKKYKINSTLLVLKIDNELQTIRVFEKIQRLLRSLDIVMQTKEKNNHYLVILFPLNGQAVALGFLNRLLTNLQNDKDKNFEHMIFAITQEDFLYQYVKDDYHG